MIDRGATRAAVADIFGNDIIVDSFAGAGGASLGLTWALGRGPDVAINHDRVAIGVHQANHPGAVHYMSDVWEVDPRIVAGGRRVRLGWFSPDCRHFSKAKGGRPVSPRVRGLAWYVCEWAQKEPPDVIILENVEEFREWGPLVEVQPGIWLPDPDRRGETFAELIERLRTLGYRVEHRELRGCDYGAPTIRKRLFVVGRRDGRAIRWPAPTHGPGRLPYRTAADIIDWSIPCQSIFGRRRPLADATLQRIAEGIRRFVLGAKSPFVITIDHRSGSGSVRCLDQPLSTIAAKARHALVTAFIAQHNTGVVGRAADTPLSTVTTSGSQQNLVTSHLMALRNRCVGQDLRAPLNTVTGMGHFAEVRAFLMKYYGTGGQHQALHEPLHTVPTRDRFGLVTVHGVEFQIVDIGMRMLAPRELARAQGFPDDYIIDRQADGTPVSKTDQVRLIGNSVCPPLADALARAQFADDLCARSAA